jgi:hypothetical protein
MSSTQCMSPLRLTVPGTEFNEKAVRRAFALVSLRHPLLSFEGWLRYLRRAQNFDRTQAGVVAIEDPRGYMHAVFRYFIEHEPPLADINQSTTPPVLRLHDLVFADLPGASLLATIAFEGEELARSLNCRGITIELPAVAEAWPQALADFSQMSGGVISKSLGSAKSAGASNGLAVPPAY